MAHPNIYTSSNTLVLLLFWPVRAEIHGRFQIDTVLQFLTVYTTTKPYRFENAPLLTAFSKRPGYSSGLYRCRVNGRRNRIAFDAVTNKTVSV